AYENAVDDFKRIDNVFTVLASYPVGHGGTYRERFGGAFGNIGLQWLDWQLKGKAEKGKLFINDDFQNDLTWEVHRKNAKLLKKK
ncbi:MAG: hypothetical protein HUJ98_02680, partial [Bacteroidaceae bacterium]|nr:hypothetical protein [Bacteroidaceae bacterium]